MARNNPNRDQNPTSPKTILLTLLTGTILVTTLTPDQAHALAEFLPLAVQFLPDGRR